MLEVKQILPAKAVRTESSALLDGGLGHQAFALLLVPGERAFDDGEGGVSGADVFDFDAFAFELFVVGEEALEDEQAVLRKIARFDVVAELGIVRRDGDDFVVAGAGIDHGHESDGAGLDERERLDRFLAENEDVERIVVFGVGLRDEAVVRGIENRGVDDAIDFEQTGGFVELVFYVGAERDLDDGGEVAGEFVAG